MTEVTRMLYVMKAGYKGCNGKVWSYFKNCICSLQILLHHDNAPAHSARRTIEYLYMEGVKLVSHPPYSPDLAPCDFYLFPKIKDKFRGICFMNPEDTVAAFEKDMEEIPKEEWVHCYINERRLLRKVINI